jgi:DNA-directed RNA polymerase specialized sigma24 family protein
MTEFEYETLVELLGRYSNWTSWADRLPATDKTGEHSRKSRSRARRTARRLSDRDVAELVTRYQEGATVYELAKRFSIHRTTVSGHLHRRGVRLRGLSPDRRQVVVATRLYEHGWSVARIGSHVGVDGSTVWRALRVRGVRMRDTHGRNR